MNLGMVDAISLPTSIMIIHNGWCSSNLYIHVVHVVVVYKYIFFEYS
jgi:hypothetical protein